MNKGKDICNELKALRRRIADENQIPLKTEECTYKGECCGTCPRCDAEVRYLEDALSHRLSLGKAATVAGLALGLAVGAGVQAQNVTDTAALKPVAKEISDSVGKIRVTGVVKDERTKEPISFAKIKVEKFAFPVAETETNDKGEFELYIAPGYYEFIVSYASTLKFNVTVYKDYKKGLDLGDIMIKKHVIMGGIGRNSFSSDSFQNYEVDGVKVIVR